MAMLEELTPAPWIADIVDNMAAQSAAAAIPRATQSLRWCNATANGSGDGSQGAPWTLAQLNSAMVSTGDLYVYMIGTFQHAAYNSIGPLIDVRSSGITIDCYTNNATVRGCTTTTWTASGVNGEYWAPAGQTTPFVRLTEDGLRMDGISTHDTLQARMLITASDTSADTITYNAYREPAAGDKIVMVSATTGSVLASTAYYIVGTPVVLGTASRRIQISATLGGAALDITTALSGDGTSRYLWSLAEGRYTDPIAGRLQPGEYCYVPEEGRTYMKPSSGSIGDHVYTYNCLNNGAHLLQAGRTGNITDVDVIGGTYVGAMNSGIQMGDGISYTMLRGNVVGTTVRGCSKGVICHGSSYIRCGYNHV